MASCAPIANLRKLAAVAENHDDYCRIHSNHPRSGGGRPLVGRHRIYAWSDGVGASREAAIAAVRALALRVAADCIDHGEEVPDPLARIFAVA
jgi:hypothetical protein